MSTISELQIYKTKEYNLFKMIDGNRLLDERKIKAIITDINNGRNYLRFFPILVDRDMNVLDGQHRLYIAKKLNLCIYYIIADVKMDIYAIAMFNSRTSRWQAKDFLNCYARRNNPNYLKIIELMEKYKVKINVAVQLLSDRSERKLVDSGRDSLKKLFESGKFEVADYEDTIKFMNSIEKHFNFFTKRNLRQFLVEVSELYENHGENGLKALALYVSSNREELERLYTTNIRHYLKRMIATITSKLGKPSN